MHYTAKNKVINSQVESLRVSVENINTLNQNQKLLIPPAVCSQAFG